jgi:hypothetical protein
MGEVKRCFHLHFNFISFWWKWSSIALFYLILFHCTWACSGPSIGLPDSFYVQWSLHETTWFFFCNEGSISIPLEKRIGALAIFIYLCTYSFVRTPFQGCFEYSFSSYHSLHSQLVIATLWPDGWNRGRGMPMASKGVDIWLGDVAVSKLMLSTMVWLHLATRW